MIAQYSLFYKYEASEHLRSTVNRPNRYTLSATAAKAPI